MDGLAVEVDVEPLHVLLELLERARPDYHRRHPAAAEHPGDRHGRRCRAQLGGHLADLIGDAEVALAEHRGL
jgi:hypothetical protein